MTPIFAVLIGPIVHLGFDNGWPLEYVAGAVTALVLMGVWINDRVRRS